VFRPDAIEYLQRLSHVCEVLVKHFGLPLNLMLSCSGMFASSAEEALQTTQ